MLRSSQWKGSIGDLRVSMGTPNTTEEWSRGTSCAGLELRAHYPWLVCGDFNEIVDNGEKLGFRKRAQRLMNNFREALTDCGLSDLGFQGPKFTWTNLQSNENVIFARLDRGVSTREWIQLFPSTRVRIIPFAPSDHHAIIVDCIHEAGQQTRRKHHFKFEAMWIKREGCEEVVRKAWEVPHEGTKMFQLVKIKGLRAKLSTIDSNIHDVWQETSRLIERHSTRKELNFLISQEEVYWRQRSRISWMREGDCNTKFFHECASQRKRKNEIKRLQSQDGAWVSEKEELGGLVNNYFQNLFTTSNPVGVNQVVNLVDRVVTEDMNRWLMRDFEALEVRQALFQMLPTKAPGPDGMSAIFFQTMGFNGTWVKIIMKCLSIVNYSVLLNGNPMATFSPSRGLRQGDPLSPYLFLLCAEGLSALLRRGEVDFLYRGVAVSRGGPRVTHLLFADDCMLFFRATTDECQAVMNILDKYEAASGQKLNNDKTSIFFSTNTPTEAREDIRKSNGGFSYKFHRAISWDFLLLWGGAKLKLLKTCLLRCGRRFKDGKRNCFLNRGERPIFGGGKGIMRGKCIGRAGMACALQNQAMELPLTFGKTNGSHPRMAIKLSLHQTIFNQAESIKQIPLAGVNKPDRLIWAQSPNGCFLVQSAYHMLVEESRKGAQGAFSSSTQRWSSFWNKLWSIQVPQNIKLFMWKTCSNILPICTKLFDRKIISNFSCPVCGEEAETINHMFIDCPVALEVWKIFFTLAWFIWRHRNEVWSGSHPGGINQIAPKASKYALEYLEAVSDPPLFQVAHESKWSPPSSPQFFKVNVASVIFKDKREVGIGAVVRNSLGEVLAATSEKVKCEGDMLWTSAISMLKTLKLLLSTGFFYCGDRML
uniref:Reverse transcriptase domain-containing protein n=1 Tax=Fagus sylvatica TaxID=28930 RepID=A0A2N9GXY8_FAGSY